MFVYKRPALRCFDMQMRPCSCISFGVVMCYEISWKLIKKRTHLEIGIDITFPFLFFFWYSLTRKTSTQIALDDNIDVKHIGNTSKNDECWEIHGGEHEHVIDFLVSVLRIQYCPHAVYIMKHKLSWLCARQPSGMGALTLSVCDVVVWKHGHKNKFWIHVHSKSLSVELTCNFMWGGGGTLGPSWLPPSLILIHTYHTYRYCIINILLYTWFLSFCMTTFKTCTFISTVTSLFQICWYWHVYFFTLWWMCTVLKICPLQLAC